MKLFRSAFLWILFLTMTSVSCANEDLYSENSFEADLCVVKGRGGSMYFFTDKGLLLYPSETLDSTSISPGDRLMVTYVSLGVNGSYTIPGYTVKVVNMQQVLVRDVVSTTGSVAAKDLIWIVNDPFFGGGFLNFEFKYKYSNSEIKHGIYLVQDSISNGAIYLRFAHEANGDEAVNTASALASFPLSSFNGFSDADSLVIQHIIGGTLSSPLTATYSLALADTVQ
jgi:hypothetical protein